MNLTFTTQKAAQTRADEIHAAMIATNADYAASAAAGQTLRWAIPQQDTDEDGKVIGTDWNIVVSERCRAVLTDAEIALFPEWNVTAP